MAEHALIPHPYNPPDAVHAVEVTLVQETGLLRLEYRVVGGALVVPPPIAPARTDELWRKTCFELFLRPDGGERYAEFNFSPSGSWAAYSFDSYRAGMRPLALDCDPTVTWNDERARVSCDLGAFAVSADLALTAVIQEAGGRCSYWSLAHPVGSPDFHHAACFAGRLPAPDEA